MVKLSCTKNCPIEGRRHSDRAELQELWVWAYNAGSETHRKCEPERTIFKSLGEALPQLDTKTSQSVIQFFENFNEMSAAISMGLMIKLANGKIYSCYVAIVLLEDPHAVHEPQLGHPWHIT